MAELVAKDARTTTAANLAHISSLTKVDCSSADRREVKAALPVSEVPEKELWRLELLDSLMRQRSEMERESKDTRRVVAMLSSLCTT